MKLHEKIDKMFKDALPKGQDFSIHFTDGRSEEICIYKDCEWEVTEEYIHYLDKDDDSMGEWIFLLNRVVFVRSV